MRKTQELKTWPESFQALFTGLKSFEFRKNDRDFKVGDQLTLLEWDNDLKDYTGRWVRGWVVFMLKSGFGLPDDYVVMQLTKISTHVELLLWQEYLERKTKQNHDSTSQI